MSDCALDIGLFISYDLEMILLKHGTVNGLYALGYVCS